MQNWACKVMTCQRLGPGTACKASLRAAALLIARHELFVVLSRSCRLCERYPNHPRPKSKTSLSPEHVVFSRPDSDPMRLDQSVFCQHCKPEDLCLSFIFSNCVMCPNPAALQYPANLNPESFQSNPLLLILLGTHAASTVVLRLRWRLVISQCSPQLGQNHERNRQKAPNALRLREGLEFMSSVCRLFMKCKQHQTSIFPVHHGLSEFIPDILLVSIVFLAFSSPTLAM